MSQMHQLLFMAIQFDLRSMLARCDVAQFKNQWILFGLRAREKSGHKMRMHDVDNSSPTTEPNLENVFQLIHRINFIFGIEHCTPHYEWCSALAELYDLAGVNAS